MNIDSFLHLNEIDNKMMLLELSWNTTNKNIFDETLRLRWGWRGEGVGECASFFRGQKKISILHEKMQKSIYNS